MDRCKPVFFAIALVLGVSGTSAMAAGKCLPPPADFAPPPGERRQVDLIQELAQPWQAGGEVVVVCGHDGRPLAGRRAAAPAGLDQETARRRTAWELVRMLNLAHKHGEVRHRSLPLPRNLEALLERFAMSDAGAVWMREVVDDTLRLFNRGHLEIRSALWEGAVATGRMPRLADLLTGQLSEAGQFSQEEPLFRLFAHPGEGAQAEPGLIAIGDKGFRCEFPASAQMVDPIAILSHEFGHTRYGDPAGAGSLLGEAATVERYENPVRERNGYEPRTVYYVRQPSGELSEKKTGLLSRLLHLQTVEGISVEDRQAIERIHCECPSPLPVILDCEKRQRSDRERAEAGALAPASDLDCKVDWNRVRAKVGGGGR